MQKRKPFFPPCLSLAGTLWVHYADGHEKFEKSDPRLKLSLRDEGSGGGGRRFFGIFICDCVTGLDLLGIPDTSLRGLNTRTARRVRKSKSEPTVERMLRRRRESAHRAINI